MRLANVERGEGLKDRLMFFRYRSRALGLPRAGRGAHPALSTDILRPAAFRTYPGRHAR